MLPAISVTVPGPNSACCSGPPAPEAVAGMMRRSIPVLGCGRATRFAAAQAVGLSRPQMEPGHLVTVTAAGILVSRPTPGLAEIAKMS